MILTEETIHLPGDFQWSCHSTGVCCRDFWELSALDEDVQRIEKLPLEKAIPDQAGISPFVPSEARPGAKALRRVKDRCCFLNSANLCTLHLAFDAEAKPLPCQVFPFKFTRTPGGVYVGLSFVCPSVMNNQGAPLKEHLPRIQRFIQHSVLVQPIREELELSEGLPLSWEDYLLVEERLLRLLNLDYVGLPDKLIAGSVWLGMLEMFLRQARAETDLPGREIIQNYADSMERNNYEQILKIARSPAESPMLQRMFLGMFISLRNGLARKPSRVGTTGRILWNYLVHFMRIGRPKLLPLEHSFSYRDFRLAHFDATDGFFEYHIRRYLTHLVFRKELIKQSDLISGYHLLLITYALIRWYGAALASRKNSTNVEREDLLEAISLTEKYYVTHSTYYRLFQQYPVISGIFYNIVRRKNFAHSFVREAV